MTVTENLLVGRHLLMRTGVFCGALYFGRARHEEMEEGKLVEHIRFLRGLPLARRAGRQPALCATAIYVLSACFHHAYTLRGYRLARSSSRSLKRWIFPV